ncbi:hypothetical protein [Bradyrhizobium sp. SZCCHNS3052]|uniref:hypothetical protein n=1 Tax=Bradyrhizobium TaxID=374 RepID=UPI002916C27C|nr:hypothetical protein [Bradyrhizobium sp. SZCCHNS3052]
MTRTSLLITRQSSPKRPALKNSVRKAPQSDLPVQHIAQKYSSFFFPEIMIVCRRPVSHEGRFAVVTNVEAGCGGRVGAAAWVSTRTNGIDAHGQVAWS